MNGVETKQSYTANARGSASEGTDEVDILRKMQTLKPRTSWRVTESSRRQKKRVLKKIYVVADDG